MSKRKFVNALLLFVMVFSLIGGKVSSPVSAMPSSPVDESKVPHYFGPYPNWANSPFTLPDVGVEIVGDGNGATASATVGANGTVTGITITSPGQGYTYANVNITGGGTGAFANAVVSTTGSVTAITVNASGSGYTAPTVTIDGGGPPFVPSSITAAAPTKFTATVGSATGGTFLLTVDALNTAPIAWNALPGDVANALLAIGFTANVTGSGSLADPYVIVFNAAPASVAIDGAGLTRGITDAAFAPAASHSFTVNVGSATGGTFLLTVDALSTAPIAWNAAAADVANSLLAIGFTATVTGSGSLADPFVIAFTLAPTSFALDPAGLTQPVLDAGFTGIIDTYTVQVGSATGGTSFLTAGALTTAPIAWNALASDVANALLAIGFNATVTGSGSLADPWVIFFAPAPTSFAFDGAGLTQGVTDAGTLMVTPLIYNATVGSASGGTFFLTVDITPTAPLAWNAAAADVANALTGIGKTASVVGSGSLIDPWVISFALTPTAVLLDGAALTQSVADSSSASLPIHTYSVNVGSATGGTFLLTVGISTTAPLAWNAAAVDLANALLAIGYTASVSGSGSVADPWTINFPSQPSAFAFDGAGLTKSVLDAGWIALGDAFSVNIGSATGGTFLLTANALTTAPIAWNAPAVDVQAAFTTIGITTTVTGSGSVADPWVIVFATAPTTFSMDPAGLTQPVLDFGLFPVIDTYHAHIGSAIGGTFLLTVNGIPTAPIAFNALPAGVTNALSAIGVIATVSGSGIVADPWVIVFAIAPTTVSLDGAGLLQAPFGGATATAYGGVEQVILDNPGFGYSIPMVDFDMPSDPNGVQASGHVICAEVDCIPLAPETTVTIVGVVVDQPGSGYAAAPNVVIRDGTIFDPVPGGGTGASAHATLFISSVVMDTYGSGFVTPPTVFIDDPTGVGAFAFATIDFGAVTTINLTAGGSDYITQGGIKKFQDGLPVLCDPSAGWANCTDNNLGQHIPIAVPDTTTFPGTDYYVIAVVQHRERMSSSLPAQGTLVREYVQLETAANFDFSKHIALQTSLLNGNTVPTLMPDGTQAVAVDDPHYLGPVIVANKDRAVRIVFYNLLPAGVDGDLFLPVDSTMMGSGMTPGMMDPMDDGTVMDGVRNPMCTEKWYDPMMRDMCFTEDRATLHLHGGISPWISDGTPHQWITPANEMTPWPEGVSVEAVPDMAGVAGVPNCSADNDGCMTFYYTNQQSARLMFYHDHSWGITRLNVYAGEAAGYVITDSTEQALVNNGTIPGAADTIPLIIQDRTFVPDANQLAAQDPTWNANRWGSYGNFWYHHVYMPAQNPGDPGGMSGYGRWMYGPWFWPPATPMHGPILNPYYNMDPATNFTTPLAVPCNIDDPATWQYDTDPFCEPQYIPGTPNVSVGMEQFNDTPIVNGTAYPTVSLDPKTYRLRILNAANDRFWNLQWYIADPTTGTDSEVALNPAEVAAAQLDPVVFPTALQSILFNGVPYNLAGPDWIQIGTEGGFLPKPVVIDGQQVTTWITDPTRFDVGNVDQHSLLLAPAERADVIVDFSKFAGKTLILYNDAPAAFPARVPSYDYYTGAPDQYPVGAPTILPGYGPNTRTIMQVKISASQPAPAFNLTALNNAFKHKADGSGVFESGQNPIIVGQAAYNSAYGTNFAASSWCNAPGAPINRCDGFARISDQGGIDFGFNTLKAPNTRMTVKIEPKAIHDEMNAVAFDEFGRMTANLGLEAVPATPGTQNVTLYPYINPGTEFIDGTNLPRADVKVTPISAGADGTQIWKITHNGVDTHPIHFHLFDVQILNRVTWDNIIIPTEASELGWKDTIRVSPLQDTIVALRAIIPVVPFELPNSIRELSPMTELNATSPMFNNMDASGNPTVPIVNKLVNFGWEYVYHCHILSHEEMDMMRPMSLALPPLVPDGLTWVISGQGNNTVLTLTWNDNSINETSFLVQKNDGTGWVDVGTVLSPLDQPNTHSQRTYADTSYRRNQSFEYRVIAQNTLGYGGEYMGMTVQSTSASTYVGTLPAAPTNLAATLQSGPKVRLAWRDNATNETGFAIERSTDGVNFTQIATAPPRAGTGNTSYVDTTVLAADLTYTYRVMAVNQMGGSAYSNLVSILVPAVPLAPSNLTASAFLQGGNAKVTLNWIDLANNETGFRIQRSTDPNFTTFSQSTVGANQQTWTSGNLAHNVTYYFRIQAYNAAGASAWVVVSVLTP